MANTEMKGEELIKKMKPGGIFWGLMFKDIFTDYVWERGIGQWFEQLLNRAPEKQETKSQATLIDKNIRSVGDYIFSKDLADHFGGGDFDDPMQQNLRAMGKQFRGLLSNDESHNRSPYMNNNVREGFNKKMTEFAYHSQNNNLMPFDWLLPLVQGYSTERPKPVVDFGKEAAIIGDQQARALTSYMTNLATVMDILMSHNCKMRAFSDENGLYFPEGKRAMLYTDPHTGLQKVWQQQNASQLPGLPSNSLGGQLMGRLLNAAYLKDVQSNANYSHGSEHHEDLGLVRGFTKNALGQDDPDMEMSLQQTLATALGANGRPPTNDYGAQDFYDQTSTQYKAHLLKANPHRNFVDPLENKKIPEWAMRHFKDYHPSDHFGVMHKLFKGDLIRQVDLKTGDIKQVNLITPFEILVKRVKTNDKWNDYASLTNDIDRAKYVESKISLNRANLAKDERFKFGNKWDLGGKMGCNYDGNLFDLRNPPYHKPLAKFVYMDGDKEVAVPYKIKEDSIKMYLKDGRVISWKDNPTEFDRIRKESIKSNKNILRIDYELEWKEVTLPNGRKFWKAELDMSKVPSGKTVILSEAQYCSPAEKTLGTTNTDQRWLEKAQERWCEELTVKIDTKWGSAELDAHLKEFGVQSQGDLLKSFNVTTKDDLIKAIKRRSRRAEDITVRISNPQPESSFAFDLPGGGKIASTAGSPKTDIMGLGSLTSPMILASPSWGGANSKAIMDENGNVTAIEVKEGHVYNETIAGILNRYNIASEDRDLIIQTGDETFRLSELESDPEFKALPKDEQEFYRAYVHDIIREEKVTKEYLPAIYKNSREIGVAPAFARRADTMATMLMGQAGASQVQTAFYEACKTKGVDQMDFNMDMYQKYFGDNEGFHDLVQGSAHGVKSKQYDQWEKE